MKSKTALRSAREPSLSRIGIRSPASRVTRGASRLPIRLLTAVPICDGHDSAINTINLEFIRQGVEVIYLGYHRSARDIVRAAIQEDVRAIGLSSYNGGHIEFFREVAALLRKRSATATQSASSRASRFTFHASRPPRVIGVTGPGGAGKTTLIDELVLRFLKSLPRARLAILSHDPSLVGAGALLGDRATMIYSQDDR